MQQTATPPSPPDGMADAVFICHTSNDRQASFRDSSHGRLRTIPTATMNNPSEYDMSRTHLHFQQSACRSHGARCLLIAALVSSGAACVLFSGTLLLTARWRARRLDELAGLASNAEAADVT